MNNISKTSRSSFKTSRYRGGSWLSNARIHSVDNHVNQAFLLIIMTNLLRRA